MLAHLLCQQSQFYITLILIAVAHDDGITLTLHGDDGVQLWFRTSLQPKVELPTVRDDFLYHWLHLIHLDGIDHIVLTLIIILLTGLPETAPCLLDTVVKDIGEP